MYGLRVQVKTFFMSLYVLVFHMIWLRQLN